MKRILIILAVIGMAGAGTAAAIITVSSDDETVTVSTETTVSRPPETAIVARKDFVETTEIEGVLGFGTISSMPNQASGVITWLPEAGSVVTFGDVLYKINDVPVIYLPGELPSYRTLDTKADGTDVLQLEAYLDSLGLMEVRNAEVDGDYTTYTAAAVIEWYETYGLEGQQSVDVGTLVFGTEPFRISSVNSVLGSQVNGNSVLSITGTTRVVSVDLDTALTGLLNMGDAVDVELPDESIVEARVSFVSQVAVTEGQGQQATTFLPVELTLDGVGSLFDESPVTIMVSEAIELDATVVPISALLALAEGGYAVEVIRDGVPVLTAVGLSNFLSNEVSIVGDVEPGDSVVIPS